MTSPRLNARDELLRVRALYLDVAQWAAEEPARWALAQLDQMARRAAATFLGIPSFGDIAGRAAIPAAKDRP